MKVLFASVEVAPFAWTGGLGDVAGALPRALHDLGVDIRIIAPEHTGVKERAPDLSRALWHCPVHMPWWVTGCSVDRSHLPYTDVPVYLVEHSHYFERDGIFGPDGGAYGDNLERFVFFCRAVIETLRGLDWQPDIIHLNDWHTALLGYYNVVWDLGYNTVYTAHQLEQDYHGKFSTDAQYLTGIDLGRPEARSFVGYGHINLTRAGIALADAANTVSQRYAWEVSQPDSDQHVHDLVTAPDADFRGILNGIDYDTWNPNHDRAIPANYSADDLSGKRESKSDLQYSLGLPQDPDIPIVCMIGRLHETKGYDLVLGGMQYVHGAQFVFLGTGNDDYAEGLRFLDATRRDVVSLIRFDSNFARRLYAGADILLMPSRREPCGLSQLVALRYGTIPVVRHTGGLADTITEDGDAQNGFVFEDYTVEGMVNALQRAFEAYEDRDGWDSLVQRAMNCDFSWDQSAHEYLQMYEDTLDA